MTKLDLFSDSPKAIRVYESLLKKFHNIPIIRDFLLTFQAIVLLLILIFYRNKLEIFRHLYNFFSRIRYVRNIDGQASSNVGRQVDSVHQVINQQANSLVQIDQPPNYSTTNVSAPAISWSLIPSSSSHQNSQINQQKTTCSCQTDCSSNTNIRCSCKNTGCSTDCHPGRKCNNLKIFPKF